MCYKLLFTDIQAAAQEISCKEEALQDSTMCNYKDRQKKEELN